MKKNNTSSQYTKATENKSTHVLRLFVDKTKSQSQAAIEKIEMLCKTLVQGSYTLEIIDIFENPKAASENAVVMVPMLIQEQPEQVTILGSMNDLKKIGLALNLPQIQN